MKLAKRFYGCLVILISALLLFNPALVIATDGTIDGNNSGSQNSITISISNNESVSSSNDANVGSDVNISLNSGGNTISNSTGDSHISTGDVLRNEIKEGTELSANTTIVEAGCCGGDPSTFEISNNNTNSTNQIDASAQTNSNVAVTQTAKITNNITGFSNTGGNLIASNGGNAEISTGNIFVQGKVSNGPVNTAVVTTKYPTNPQNMSITNNNSGSINVITTSNVQNFSQIINNVAWINNFVNWNADTGSNKIKDNLGNATITTGDIFFSFVIENGPINTTISEIDGCCDPGYNDEDDGDGDDEDNGGSDDNGKGGSSDGNGGDSSNGSVAGGAVEAAVLGLTGNSFDNFFYLLFTLGAIVATLGIRHEFAETKN